MGLDMYFYRVPKNEAPSRENLAQIAYFRKHSDLHGWLERLWRERPGNTGEFNCVFMEISPDILVRLKDYLKTPEKEKFMGFFWGQSQASDWQRTRELVPELESIIKSGDRVYYYSWW